jgi:electron transport complex protein RnfG
MTTAAAHMPAVAPPSSLKMIGTLAVVSFLSGLIIFVVVAATKTKIDTNRREALERAVRAVLPDVKTNKPFEITETGFRPVEEQVPGMKLVHAAYNADGELVGVAFDAAAQGYAGPVRSLFGYVPDRDAIVGFEVLDSTETPGLGSRISSDATFVANFENLDVQLTADGAGLANPIEFVKPGKKQNPWQVDGISGATISSKAVTNSIATRGEEIIPYIKKHLDQLKDAN